MSLVFTKKIIYAKLDIEMCHRNLIADADFPSTFCFSCYFFCPNKTHVILLDFYCTSNFLVTTRTPIKITYSISHISCHISNVTYSMSHITSHIQCHIDHVTYLKYIMSHIWCHIFDVVYLTFFFDLQDAKVHFHATCGLICLGKSLTY